MQHRLPKNDGRETVYTNGKDNHGIGGAILQNVYSSEQVLTYRKIYDIINKTL